MLLTTLCYLEQDDQYLMLHRISKKNDVNKDKWIGIGGKFEFGESPEDCLLREAKEETGYTLTDYRLRGIVTFLFNDEEAEYMFLYTAAGFEGEPSLCSEGTLEWVKKSEIDRLNLWEGDRIFFELLDQNRPFFSLKLHYRGDRLEEAVLDGEPMELVDVLDESGEPSGLVRERGMVHARGDYHRTGHVWVVRKNENRNWEVLLQKRSEQKESFPGCYDVSSAGHIPAGDGYAESALRELEEELGISARSEDLQLIGFHEHRFSGSFHGNAFLDREKQAVFVYRKPVNEAGIRIQKSEIESVVFMELEKVYRAVRERHNGYCIYEDELDMLKTYLENAC